MVIKRRLGEALALGLHPLVQGCLVLLLLLQGHTQVHSGRTQRLTQIHGRAEQARRLHIVAALQRICALVQKRTPAAHGLGRRLGVNLGHRIGPDTACVVKTVDAAPTQHSQHQTHHHSRDDLDFALRIDQRDGDQQRHRDGPQITAVKHKGVLNPDGGELGDKHQARQQNRQSRQRPSVAAAQDHHGTTQHGQHIGHRPQGLNTPKAQRKLRANIHRHEAGQRDPPGHAIAPKQAGLVPDAQGKQVFADARLDLLELRRESPGRFIEHHPHNAAVHLQQQKR